MLPLLPWRKYCQAALLFCFFCSSEGLNLAASFPGPTEKTSVTPVKHPDSLLNASLQTPSLESVKIGTSLLSTSNLAMQSLELSSPSTSLLRPVETKSSSINSTSPIAMGTDASPSISHSPPVLNLTSPPSSSSYIKYPTESHPAVTLPDYELRSVPSYLNASDYYTSGVLRKGEANDSTVDADSFTHFHTPLMSLLAASPSSSLQMIDPSPITSTTTSSTVPNGPAQPTTSSSSDNESPSLSDSNHQSSVPTTDPQQQEDHKKLLMLVLRAEDCARFSKSDFERMLSKLMAKFGFDDVVPEVSSARCYTHLDINVTVGGGALPTLRFLPNVGGHGSNNFTVDVLNRTFRIIKLEKVDLRLEKPAKSSSPPNNASSDIIAAVAKHESVAYVAVGVSFGLVLVVCVSVCCIKCCCLRKPKKRYGVPKGAHVRLRPEDYTLTPIPRPTSLYVDYYRGSGTADIYSTTSAGSIASTVEQGVVQPFDTSIVPLEDSSNLPLDSSRDPSVESVPVQSDLKTFNIHSSLAGKGFRTASTDSKEQLNPKAHSRRVEAKPSGGVANPTFQRY